MCAVYCLDLCLCALELAPEVQKNRLLLLLDDLQELLESALDSFLLQIALPVDGAELPIEHLLRCTQLELRSLGLLLNNGERDELVSVVREVETSLAGDARALYV